jgi:hypothetical protein
VENSGLRWVKIRHGHQALRRIWHRFNFLLAYKEPAVVRSDGAVEWKDFVFDGWGNVILYDARPIRTSCFEANGQVSTEFLLFGSRTGFVGRWRRAERRRSAYSISRRMNAARFARAAARLPIAFFRVPAGIFGLRSLLESLWMAAARLACSPSALPNAVCALSTAYCRRSRYFRLAFSSLARCDRDSSAPFRRRGRPRHERWSDWLI